MFFSIFALCIVVTSVRGDECTDICRSLEECRTDPRGRGSFCKTDKNPQVCFGLYYKNSAKTEICYQPNSSSCPDTNPVLCGASAVATTVASAVVTPSGRYAGSALYGTVGLTANFNPQAMTLDIGVTVAGSASFNGIGMPFTMSENGLEVYISDTPQRAAFLNSLPVAVPAHMLIIRYNPSTNRVTGVFNNIEVDTRQV
jgi:hypothetical protein